MSFDYTKDPTTHAPAIDENFNTMERWGIVDPIDEGDDFQAFASKMTMLHGGDPDKEPTLEQKFIQKLKERKIAELKKYERDSGMIPCKRDYVFDLKLMDCVGNGGKDVVTRKFRCSGDMNLRTFAEKLLLPIMGYMRGYHAWVLTDQKDGAVFGTDAQTIDSMHMWNHGSTAMRDIDWTIAHVLRKQGNAFCWIYDLGDQYRHMITATEIRAPEASDGHFELLGGIGAQPAEDHQGNRGWQEIITKILEGKDTPSLHKQISEAANYRTIYKLHGSPRNWRLNPLKWDQAVTMIALGASLEFRIAPKVQKLGLAAMMAARGNTAGPDRGYTDKEDANMAICGMCGKPNVDNTLKKCSRCKVTYYCSVTCQKAKWPQHKDYCKTLRDEDTMYTR